jgi:adenylate cyclase
LRIGLLLLALAAGALLSQARFAAWTDSQLHDLLTGSLPPRAAPAQVVLVDIDEFSVGELGPWPWPRSVVAELVRSLRERGARLQVWDVFFPEPAAGDAGLQAALAAAPDVVLGQVLVTDASVQSPPRVGEPRAYAGAPEFCSEHPPVAGWLAVSPGLTPSLAGHLTSTPDADGRLRRLPAVLCAEGRRYPQLVVAAAQALEPRAGWAVRDGAFLLGPDRWLERGSLRFALDAHGFLPVPYHRPHTAWPAVSAARLLDPKASAPPLQGAVVLVGATALGVGDTANTPRHPNAPGVGVHAELLGAALENAWVHQPRSPAVLAALLVGLAGLLLLPRLQFRNRALWLVLGLAFAAAAPALVAVLARLGGVMLPVTAPALSLAAFLLSLLLLEVAAERRQAQRLAAHLESFLPRGLAHDIAQQNPSGESLGKPCHGVLLAVRVVGLERWTTSVDSLQALALVHAVNTVAERCAARHGGALEHVQGETFLMAWPRADADAVRAAVAAGRELLIELGELLQRNESQRHPLGARAALEAGAFLLGVAGSRSSRRPLLLGPAADVVLAMLALCDELASQMLVGAQAAQTRPGDQLHSLGQFLLPDQPEPRPLYRVDV